MNFGDLRKFQHTSNGGGSSADTGPFASLLAAPENIVGRDAELARLRDAIDSVFAGGRRVILLAGSAGVGKSALIDELRQLAAARGARFVAGKFDQQNEKESDAIFEALGALGRLLHAAPAEERVAVRSRIVRTLGSNAGLARVVPELALLMSDVPVPGVLDPAHAAARLVEVVAGLLRAVASPQRPLVLVLDDLQWSGALSARLLDAVLGAGGLEGLLLVGAFRDDEMEPAGALAAALDRWGGERNGPELLRLGNLRPEHVAQFVGRVLEADERTALRLAQAVRPRALGNPYDTLELLNGLRDELLIARGPSGWSWDDSAVHDYLERNSVLDVLATRIAHLSQPAQELLQALVCLGTTTSGDIARTMAGLGEGEFEQAVAALRLRGFLLPASPGDGLLRVRHDGVRQAVYAGMPAATRAGRHLALARRAAMHEGYAPVAADQFVSGVDCVSAGERAPVATLLMTVAAQARERGNYLAAHRMLEAALLLLRQESEAGGAGAAAEAECEIAFHLALYTLGRLEDADAMYGRIERREPDMLHLAEAACVQVQSLANRGRTRESLALGLDVARRLGLHIPEEHRPRYEAGQIERLRQWVGTFDLAVEVSRPEARAPWVVATAKVLACLLSPAFYESIGTVRWLVLQSFELWTFHGPCAALAVSLSRAGLAEAAFDHDRRSAYLAARNIVELCEARGWHAEAASARFAFAMCCVHWFEPAERRMAELERAREGLLASGDPRNACFCYRNCAVTVLECAPSLKDFERELQSALALARRAGNRQAMVVCQADMQLLRALRGQTEEPTSFDDEQFSGARFVAQATRDPRAVANYAATLAIACAISGDGPRLAFHARWASSLQDRIPSLYPIAWVHWLLGLASALELQQTEGGRPDELDACIEWIRQHAIDAPFNFRHMHLHLQAERAWARGDAQSSARLFDEAQAAAEANHRPWHQALIVERAARFSSSQGWDHAARRLLGEALGRYEAWGATAKVAQLRAELGTVSSRDGPVFSIAVHETADRLSVLRASQALVSERTTARLQARAEEVLRGVTGATNVSLALRDPEGDWVVRTGESPASGVEHARRKLPLAAVRYAERTCEPLVLADAIADDRFGRDECLRGLERCSLMVVPVLRQGEVRAMLVLENRDARAAFSSATLDDVMMIAAQLAVSLESAQLYERLERRVQEQTRQLHDAQSRLVAEARRSGMAQIATNVLHDVGNVLNSVNVSAHVLAAQVRQSRTARLADMAQLLESNAGDLRRLFEHDENGRLLPAYTRDLARALAGERAQLLGELSRLEAGVAHIKAVVAMQQSFAGASDVVESARITELVDDALRIHEDALARDAVHVLRDWVDVPPALLDRTRVMQILLNLIDNAREAVRGNKGERKLAIAVRELDGGGVEVEVADNGCGIGPDALPRIFSHGFTTKPDGHGFGLHSCALAAREMGGAMEVRSGGGGGGRGVCTAPACCAGLNRPRESPSKNVALNPVTA